MSVQYCIVVCTCIEWMCVGMYLSVQYMYRCLCVYNAGKHVHACTYVCSCMEYIKVYRKAHYTLESMNSISVTHPMGIYIYIVDYSKLSRILCSRNTCYINICGYAHISLVTV